MGTAIPTSRWNRPEKTRQGVTAEVVGNCGFSAYHVRRPPRHGGTFGRPSAAAMAGAGTLRGVPRRNEAGTINGCVPGGPWQPAAPFGYDQRALDPRDGPPGQTLSDALAEGAAGFSTGLMCTWQRRRGNAGLAQGPARAFTPRICAAIPGRCRDRRQIELARRAGCRPKFHLQASGRTNWPKRNWLEKIERARDEGIDVAFDSYPYLVGSTVMTQLLPQ